MSVMGSLRAFFDAENARDWERYAQYLHPAVEWVVEGRTIRGIAAYLATIQSAYQHSDAQFHCLKLLPAADGRVWTLLEDSGGNWSLDVFQFQGGLIRREWEYLLGPAPPGNHTEHNRAVP